MRYSRHVFVLLLFYLGCCIGSFLECMVERHLNKDSFYGVHSICLNCKEELGFLDLWPLFSFLYLKGRCRYCHTKLPRKLFYMELWSGVILLFCYLRFGIDMEFFYHLLFSYGLFLIARIDFETYRILNRLLLFELFLICCKNHYLYQLPFQKRDILVGGSIFLILYGIRYAYWKMYGIQGMGFGDLKLLFVLGCYLSYPRILYCVLVSCLFGILFCMQKKSTKIPFAPSLCLATFLCTICSI